MAPVTGAFVNNGTVNPGSSPGTLTVGTYTAPAGSAQVVEIASATKYDKIITTLEAEYHVKISRNSILSEEMPWSVATGD
jgi:hypothetical protein